jgi:hypothetical protein
MVVHPTSSGPVGSLILNTGRMMGGMKLMISKRKASVIHVYLIRTLARDGDSFLILSELKILLRKIRKITSENRYAGYICHLAPSSKK